MSTLISLIYRLRHFRKQNKSLQLNTFRKLSNFSSWNSLNFFFIPNFLLLLRGFFCVFALKLSIFEKKKKFYVIYSRNSSQWHIIHPDRLRNWIASRIRAEYRSKAFYDFKSHHFGFNFFFLSDMEILSRFMKPLLYLMTVHFLAVMADNHPFFRRSPKNRNQTSRQEMEVRDIMLQANKQITVSLTKGENRL